MPRFGLLELMKTLVVLVVNIGFIAALVLALRYLFFRKSKTSTPLDIAQQRYASGDNRSAV